MLIENRSSWGSVLLASDDLDACQCSGRGGEAKIFNINNCEKKKGKGRRKDTVLTYFLSFVSWNNWECDSGRGNHI